LSIDSSHHLRTFWQHYSTYPTVEPCIIHNANTVKSDGVLTVLSVVLSTASAVLIIVGDATATGSTSAGDDAIECDTYGNGTGGCLHRLSSFVSVAGLVS